MNTPIAVIKDKHNRPGPLAFTWLPIHLTRIVLTFEDTDLSLLYLLTYLLTHSMEQSPSWENNRFSASREISRILWNPKVHYHIHMCPPPVPILSQLDLIHGHTFHFLNIHLNIVLSKSGSSKWSLSFRFPQQSPIYASPFPHACYMPPARPTLWKF